MVHQPKPSAFLMILPWTLILDSHTIWARAGRVGRNNYVEVNETVDLSYLFEGNVPDMGVQFIRGIYAMDLHNVFNFTVLKKAISKTIRFRLLGDKEMKTCIWNLSLKYSSLLFCQVFETMECKAYFTFTM